MIVLQALWISGCAIGSHEFLNYLVSKFPNTRLKKPFSCPSCLSFWIGLIGSITVFDPMLIFLPFIITKIINKYLWS
jgi:hypothetical protein